MSKFKIIRVNALPQAVEPSAMYIVKSADSTVANLYFTSTDGSITVPGVTEQFVIDKVSQLNSSGWNDFEIVETITERNAMLKPGNTLIMVVDASGDEFGSTGSVLYMYRKTTDTYLLMSSFNGGGGVAVSWASISGRPNSSAANIDSAVQNSHTHINMATLNRIGINTDGQMLVDGAMFANVVMLPGSW